MNLLQKLWQEIFPAKKVSLSIPIIVPTTLLGSPNYVQPTTNNTTENWDNLVSLPYGNQQEVLPNGDLYLDNCTVEDTLAHVQGLMNYYKDNNDDEVSDFIKSNYLNAQGFVKLSVRYNSVMAKIQENLGANIGDVWNSYAIYGFIPEHLWPELPAPFTFSEYMAPIPQKLIDFGKNSAKLFQVVWSVIQNNNWNPIDVDLFKKNLITSPISWAGPIGNIDTNGIEQYAGEEIYEHCRLITSIDTNINVLDNYPINGSFKRKLALNFPIPCAIVASIKII